MINKRLSLILLAIVVVIEVVTPHFHEGRLQKCHDNGRRIQGPRADPV